MKPPFASGVLRLRNRFSVVRVDLLPRRGGSCWCAVTTFIGFAPAPRRTLGGIQTGRSGHRGFHLACWVQTKAVAGLVFPLIHGPAQTLHNRDAFSAKLLAVVQVLAAAEQRVNGFMDSM